MSLSIARVVLSKRILAPKVSIPFMQTSISSFTTAAPAGVAPQQHAPPKNRIKPVSNGREFLDKLKGKVEKKLLISKKDIEAIVTQCTSPEDFKYNLEAIEFFEGLKMEFNEGVCNQFVQNGLNADQAKEAANLLIEPHELGKHLTEKTYLDLFNALVKKGHVHEAYMLSKTVIFLGKNYTKKENFENLITAYKKLGAIPKNYRKVIRLAMRTVTPEEFAAIQKFVGEPIA